MMQWVLFHPKMTPEMLGLIPYFLSEDDPRPAREQFDENYHHGGGFHPIPRFELLPNGDLKYPGDPPLSPLAEVRLRDEVIRVYDYAWVCVVQPDGSFEVARID